MGPDMLLITAPNQKVKKCTVDFACLCLTALLRVKPRNISNAQMQFALLGIRANKTISATV